MNLKQLKIGKIFLKFAKLIKIPRISNKKYKNKKHLLSIAKSLNLNYIKNEGGNLLLLSG